MKTELDIQRKIDEYILNKGACSPLEERDHILIINTLDWVLDNKLKIEIPDAQALRENVISGLKDIEKFVVGELITLKDNIFCKIAEIEDDTVGGSK